MHQEEIKTYLAFGNFVCVCARVFIFIFSSCSILNFYSVSRSWPLEPTKITYKTSSKLIDLLTFSDLQTFSVASVHWATAANRYCMQAAGARDTSGFCPKPGSFQVTHLPVLPSSERHPLGRLFRPGSPRGRW